ncbi:MAG TPA: hypothetical protein VGD26_09725 [Chitinophagaceae bacterium]
MIRYNEVDGILREKWDDDSSPRIVTFYDSNGVQTNSRQYTPDENAEVDARIQIKTISANEDSLVSKARAALNSNNTYLAIASPTAAQNTAQIKSLTRQINALIKLQIRDLLDITGT